MSEEVQQSQENNTDTQQEKQGEKTDWISLSKDAFNDRLEQAGRSAQSKILSKLGFEDIDGLASALQEFSQLRDSKLSEEEKTAKKLKELQDAKDKAEQRATEVEQELANTKQRILVSSAENVVIDLANKAGVTKPAYVRMYIESSYGQPFFEAVYEGGEVDNKAANKMVTKMQEAHPEFFKQSEPGTPSNHDAQSHTSKSKEDLKKEVVRNINY